MGSTAPGAFLAMGDALRLLDAWPEPLLVADAGGRFLAVNGAALRLLGVERTELLGAPVECILPERIRGAGGGEAFRQVQARHQALAGRGARTAVRRGDGVEITVELLVGLARLGELGEVLVIGLRRLPAAIEPEAEQGLAAPDPSPDAERTTHRLVFEAAPVGIFRFDAAGVITAANEAFARILGSSRQVLIGLDTQTLPDPGIVASIRAVLDGRRAYYEGDYRAATSGKVTPVRVDFAPLRLEDGRLAGGVGIVEDVTARHAAEQALRQSEASFRTLSESSPAGIGVFRGGKLTYRNPALLALTSPDPDAAAREILTAEDEAALAAALARPASTWSPLPVRQVGLTRRNGETARVEVTLLPVHFDGGPAVLVVVHDVTERRVLESRLAHADRMASIGTLAAGVAHEINNPLAVMLGSLSVAEGAVRRLEASGQAARDLDLLRDAFDGFREATERVRTIVRDLMTFSRPQAESRSPVNVELVLDSTTALAGNEIRHRARLLKDYGGVPLVVADEARLGQVFLNLLMNAVQALPEGRASESTIRVSTRTSGGRVVIDLEDSGPGIPAGERSRVFEPFYTTKPAGTGLGLSICHGIVESFGGTIEALSGSAGGALIRVELPAASADVAPRPGSSTPPRTAAPRARILVIDDEPLLGRTLRIALQGRHDVEVALGGREGLALLEHDQSFDLVLCDLMMPDVGGSAVYQEVQRLAPALVPRFTFMTGGAFTDAARAFLDAFAGPTLEKPFDTAQVEGLLAEVRARATSPEPARQP